MVIILTILLFMISATASAMGSNCISIDAPYNSYAFIIRNQILVINGQAYRLLSRHRFEDAYVTEFYYNEEGKYTYGVIRQTYNQVNNHHDYIMVFDQYDVNSNNLIKTENFICDSQLFHTIDI